MKGIILAGGSGTRLQPITNVLSKQVLPVYDKPMIHYPLTTLINLNIREVLIISTPRDLPMIKDLLKDGKKYGLEISYKVQEQPRGIAEAFIIGEKFIGNDSVCLILGDNIFYSSDLCETQLSKDFSDACHRKTGATITAYHISNPQKFGVVELGTDKKTAISIEEKPKNPKSNWAVTGLYFYDNKVSDIAKSLKPSQRGELEITDINRIYMEQKELHVITTGRGFVWLDAGTIDSLMDAAIFVQTIEKRQSIKLACLEETVLRKKLISVEKYQDLIDCYSKSSDYRKYLENILDEVTKNND